jgi:hypothetical protein
MLTAEVALTTRVDRHVAARTPLVRVVVCVLVYVSNRSVCLRLTLGPPTLARRHAGAGCLAPLFSPAVGEDAGVPERDHLLVGTVMLLEGVEANVGWTFKLGD